MTSEPTQHYYADVVIIGFGAAGDCAAIEAHDAGANLVLLEKQPEATHDSNTRMSGGGFHSNTIVTPGKQDLQKRMEDPLQ